MKILNIETRYHFIYLNYSTVYNIIVFGVIYYILFHMNFKVTTNCMSSNDCLTVCMLKWCSIAPYFMRKEAKAIKAVTK